MHLIRTRTHVECHLNCIMLRVGVKRVSLRSMTPKLNNLNSFPVTDSIKNFFLLWEPRAIFKKAFIIHAIVYKIINWFTSYMLFCLRLFLLLWIISGRTTISVANYRRRTKLIIIEYIVEQVVQSCCFMLINFVCFIDVWIFNEILRESEGMQK